VADTSFLGRDVEAHVRAQLGAEHGRPVISRRHSQPSLRRIGPPTRPPTGDGVNETSDHMSEGPGEEPEATARLVCSTRPTVSV
jgi:hypothetical protein